MRFIALSAFLVVLGGCGLFPGYTQVEGAFVVGTKKTMSDHIISMTSGKNCSSVRREKGMTYCEEDEVAPKYESYCYRTLGNVTCYDRPNPFNGRQQIVDEQLENPTKAVRR